MEAKVEVAAVVVAREGEEETAASAKDSKSIPVTPSTSYHSVHHIHLDTRTAAAVSPCGREPRPALRWQRPNDVGNPSRALSNPHTRGARGHIHPLRPQPAAPYAPTASAMHPPAPWPHHWAWQRVRWRQPSPVRRTRAAAQQRARVAYCAHEYRRTCASALAPPRQGHATRKCRRTREHACEPHTAAQAGPAAPGRGVRDQVVLMERAHH